MMICPRCHNVMSHVFRFTPDRNCELDICKNCYFETKPKRLKYDSIEIMQDNTKRNTKEKVKKVVESLRISHPRRSTRKERRNNVFRICNYIKRIT